MALVPASSRGGGLPLSGGKITGNVEIDSTNTGTSLLLKGAAVQQWDFIECNDNGGNSFFQVNRPNSGAIVVCGIGAGAASDTALTANANPGQSVDIAQFTSSGGTPLSGVDLAGRIYTTQGFASQVIASGALPTVAPVSATAFQCSTTRDVFLVVPVTFNPTAGAAATCKVELSPDNVTYSIVGTETEPAGIAFDGTIHLISLAVPAAWRVKLTVVNATLGTGTFY